MPSDTSPASRPLLVTSALPYANGLAHLGHLVEHVQTDIWVRFQRLTGREVLYVCAADTHGTPIEVNARKQGLSPTLMTERFRQEQARDFAAFGISHDVFYTTHSPENRAYAERIYAALKAKGLIYEKPLEQFYDETAQRFLPDRFVKGRCPKCGTVDQYGDNCESCGATYTPIDLVEPYSVLTGKTPVRRSSNHLWVDLKSREAEVRDFLATLSNPAVRNFVQKWLDAGLEDWCISRDAPYFGFEIPGTDKFFYVWMDAPVGYVSSTAWLAKQRGLDLHKWWPGTADKPLTDDDVKHGAEIVHVIGKDIVYFHTLFWPVMLKAAGFQLPSDVHVHGMLNFGGAKMSKSRGRMITIRDWLAVLDPSYLRYYLAANLGPGLDDIEFSTDELKNRVNSQLVNNVGNLTNRVLKFVAAQFDGKLSTASAFEGDDLAKLRGFIDQAKAAFEQKNARAAIQQVEAIGFWANEFMQRKAPFRTVKTDPAQAQSDATLLATVIKALATLLLPVVPSFSRGMLSQLNVKVRTWDDGTDLSLPAGHRIGTPTALLPPMEPAVIEKLFAPKETPVTVAAAPAPVAAPAENAVIPAAGAIEPIKEAISIDDFGKIDLRVGIVVAAEGIPGADKLLKLSVDVGEGTPRTIAAGIAKAYKPEELVGRRVVVVANLAPREMKVGKTKLTSQGMLLAAGGGPRGLTLADVPEASPAGSRVK